MRKEDVSRNTLRFKQGVVDLITMKAIVWTGEEMGAKFEEREIPADLVDKCKEMHDELVENAVEEDEEKMMAFLEGEEPSPEELTQLVRKGKRKKTKATEYKLFTLCRSFPPSLLRFPTGTLAGSFVPVICGTAFKNKGVQPLLDSVVKFLPSPLDLPDMKGLNPKNTEEEVMRKADDSDPFSGLAFKIMSDPFVGNLTFVRIYSGILHAGSYVLNATKNKKERVGRMLEMHANDRQVCEMYEKRDGASEMCVSVF